MTIGHTKNARGERQDLVDHLRAVSSLTEQFAAPLGAAEAGRLLGLWHDVGKWHPRFQAYLERCEIDPKHREYVDHKAAGAELASRHLGWPLAMVIQAHHGGLQDPTGFDSWLKERRATGEPETSLALAGAALQTLEPHSPPSLPLRLETAKSELEVELFLRLMFSALVDADSLDTEGHEYPERRAVREPRATIDELWQLFAADQEQHMASQSQPTSLVNEVRRTVYEACLAAADRPTGVFRLTVPTGGGKTRSGMAFALRHAQRHGLRRIVVAVPFLTITDQTAAEYRKIFDRAGMGGTVLEHHSQAGDSNDESFDADSVWDRLAAENWDAPIIVTTTIQLLESLFSNRRSACRKLHRLSESVVILDEAQALPSRLLSPILDVLRELTSEYGSSVVVSTATQPAFEVIPEFARIKAREIIPEPIKIFTALKRVRYDWQHDRAMSWADVADLIREAEQVLAVVNTKPDAHALLAAIGDPDALHLSATLCGAHRRDVIGDVKARLLAGMPCRLVTTQVVEAGVDIDFPLVLRALAPLDSILQAAGRCNREGSLAEGRVVIFDPADGGLPAGDGYRMATDKTRALLASRSVDPDDPATAVEYFRSLLVPPFTDTDREGIQSLRGRLAYPDVARSFRMIKDDTESVVVRYRSPLRLDDPGELIERLRGRRGDGRALWRSVQPYLVSMVSRKAERYRAEGLITEVVPGLGEWHGRYDGVLGLIDGLGPEELIA